MLLKTEGSPNHEASTALTEQFQTYLREVLGANLAMHKWQGWERLPKHLTAAFSLQETKLSGSPVMVAFDRGRKWTVSGLRKQLDIIAKATTLPVLFVTEGIKSFERSQLIKNKIAFAVPGRQLYLPPLGLDLRERFSFTQPLPTGRLSASSQAVVIFALIHPSIEVFSPRELAGKLDYVPMTMTRVFNELESNGLARTTHSGKNRFLKFDFEGQNLWLKAKSLLASPITKRIWVDGDQAVEKEGVKAGLSALADMSDLAPPESPVLAVPPSGWNWPGPTGTIKHIFRQPQDGATEVEFWAYPPRHFAQDGRVDPFSLYLSLRETNDERVEQALQQLERNLW